MPFERLSKKGLPFPVVADDPVATQELAELVEVSDAYIMEQWGTDIVLTGGLTYAYKGGTVFTGGAYSHVADGTITLAASDVNYVERDAAGSVTVNQTAFSVDKLPMAKVTTDVTGITDLEDWRVLETPAAATVGSHVVATTTALGPSHSVSALASGMVLRATGATTSAYGYLVASDIPSLGASKITAGTFGTGAYVFDSTVGGITTLSAAAVVLTDFAIPGLLQLRSANGTEGSPTATAFNDVIGSVEYFGHDGGGFDAGAFIRVEAREAWTATNHGCEIQFFTTGLGGQSTPTARWRFEPQGSLMTVSENVDIGSAGSGRVRDLFTVRHVIVGGDFTVVGTTTFNTVTYTWPATDGSAGDFLSTNSSGVLSWIAAGGDVTSVSGTASRITCSPTTGAVVVNIHTSYVGQTSITTLGTVGTGTWQGASISTSYTAAKLTSVTGGTGIDVSASTGAVTFTLDVSELGLGGTLVGSDWLVAANASVSNRQVISSIPLSIFNNNLGWTANSGDITGVNITAGTGLSGSVNTSSGTHTQVLTVDSSQTQITAVGVLGGGGISSGFGAINIGTSTLACGQMSTTASGLVTNLNANYLGGTNKAGFSLAGHVHPAVDITSGTFVSARLSGSYTGITGIGTLSTLFQNTGGAKIEVQNAVDGGNSRGIFMWTSTDSNWGIYMGQSGGGNSLSDGTAVAGSGFSAHAIRFRVSNNVTQGFVFENSSEQLLMSIRGSDGNVWIKNDLEINGTLNHDGNNVGLYNVAPIARQQVIGSRSSGTALTNLLIKLALTGIIINGTSA